jgi:hypothetical protein
MPLHFSLISAVGDSSTFFESVQGLDFVTVSISQSFLEILSFLVQRFKQVGSLDH